MVEQTNRSLLPKCEPSARSIINHVRRRYLFAKPKVSSMGKRISSFTDQLKSVPDAVHGCIGYIGMNLSRLDEVFKENETVEEKQYISTSSCEILSATRDRWFFVDFFSARKWLHSALNWVHFRFWTWRNCRTLFRITNSLTSTWSLIATHVWLGAPDIWKTQTGKEGLNPAGYRMVFLSYLLVSSCLALLFLISAMIPSS